MIDKEKNEIQAESLWQYTYYDCTENIRNIIQNGIKLEGTVIDIGAMYGFFACYAARMGCQRVVAIEASPQNYQYLLYNVCANGLQDKILCLNMAVHNVGNITLGFLRAGNPGQVSSMFISQEGIEPIYIPTISFSHLFDFFYTPQYIKIDIESGEYNFIDYRVIHHLRKIEYLDLDIHPLNCPPYNQEILKNNYQYHNINTCWTEMEEFLKHCNFEEIIEGRMYFNRRFKKQ